MVWPSPGKFPSGKLPGCPCQKVNGKPQPQREEFPPELGIGNGGTFGIIGDPRPSFPPDLFREVLNDAQTIIWNGPMGVYEMDKYAKGSLKMSHNIADANATTIVEWRYRGCGTSSDVEEMTFVSTGGGQALT